MSLPNINTIQIDNLIEQLGGNYVMIATNTIRYNITEINLNVGKAHIISYDMQNNIFSIAAGLFTLNTSPTANTNEMNYGFSINKDDLIYYVSNSYHLTQNIGSWIVVAKVCTPKKTHIQFGINNLGRIIILKLIPNYNGIVYSEPYLFRKDVHLFTLVKNLKLVANLH